MYTAVLLLLTDPKWVVTMVSLGLSFGSLSYLISIRRLFYLAESSPHIALFIFTLSTLIIGFYGLETLLLSISIGVFTIVILGVSTRKTKDQDKNVSLMIGLSASLNVLTLYVLMKSNFRGISLATIFIGDPLLTTTQETITSLTIALITLTTVTLTLREQLITSIDKDFAKVAKLRTWLYDSIAYATLALNTIGLLKITGFILQHVLALLPPIAISMMKRGLWESYLLTIISTAYIALLSLNASLILGIPPSGVIGLTYIIYIVAIRMKR